MGNDLVRFIDLTIGRPTVVSGLSSGGVLSAWMSAYARPGQVRGAHYEDPPLFSSEVNPACGQSIRQGAGAIFALWSKYLGDQWTVGNWTGLREAWSAGALHPRQHGQRPGPFHRPDDRPTDRRERPLDRGRPGRLDVGVCKMARFRGAHYEDPPLFSSETNPACGQSIRQGAGAIFALWSKYLGDQWTVGNWTGLRGSREHRALHGLPPWLAAAVIPGDRPPQNLKEYDPEWGRAFVSGTVAASCDHARMLEQVQVPVLLTHHFRAVDDRTGALLGALSDVQASFACELIRAAGQPVEYTSFPGMGHSMHGEDPELFARTLAQWAATLP